MALEMVLRRMDLDGVTVRGFRSSFSDWAGNETAFSRELAEHALVHVIGDKAEQAYRQSDALARRRELMDAWARHARHGDEAGVIARFQAIATALDAARDVYALAAGRTSP